MGYSCSACRTRTDQKPPSLEDVVAESTRYPFDLKNLRTYTASNHCNELLDFLIDVHAYTQAHASRSESTDELNKKFHRILDNFIRPMSPGEINLTADVRGALLDTELAQRAYPVSPAVFDMAVQLSLDLLYDNVYTGFLSIAEKLFKCEKCITKSKHIKSSVPSSRLTPPSSPPPRDETASLPIKELQSIKLIDSSAYKDNNAALTPSSSGCQCSPIASDTRIMPNTSLHLANCATPGLHSMHAASTPFRSSRRSWSSNMPFSRTRTKLRMARPLSLLSPLPNNAANPCSQIITSNFGPLRTKSDTCSDPLFSSASSTKMQDKSARDSYDSDNSSLHTPIVITPVSPLSPEHTSQRSSKPLPPETSVAASEAFAPQSSGSSWKKIMGPFKQKDKAESMISS